MAVLAAMVTAVMEITVEATATQADIQRGFDTQAVISKLDGISNGLCDGFML